MNRLVFVTGILFLCVPILGVLALSVDKFLAVYLHLIRVPRDCNPRESCFHLNLDLGDRNNFYTFR